MAISPVSTLGRIAASIERCVSGVAQLEGDVERLAELGGHVLQAGRTAERQAYVGDLRHGANLLQVWGTSGAPGTVKRPQPVRSPRFTDAGGAGESVDRPKHPHR